MSTPFAWRWTDVSTGLRGDMISGKTNPAPGYVFFKAVCKTVL